MVGELIWSLLLALVLAIHLPGGPARYCLLALWLAQLVAALLRSASVQSVLAQATLLQLLGSSHAPLAVGGSLFVAAALAAWMLRGGAEAPAAPPPPAPPPPVALPGHPPPGLALAAAQREAEQARESAARMREELSAALRELHEHRRELEAEMERRRIKAERVWVPVRAPPRPAARRGRGSRPKSPPCPPFCKTPPDALASAPPAAGGMTSGCLPWRRSLLLALLLLHHLFL